MNRNTIKLSYKCCPNLKKIISAHNSGILNKMQPKEDERTCNCNKNDTFPLNGQCLTKNIVYQATVKQENSEENTYIGLTAQTLKKRWNKHNFDFRHIKNRTETKLSGHIWDLKESNIKFDIDWKILDRAKPFSPISETCNLCTREKYYIVYKSELGTLNHRDEMKSNCRHKQPVILDKT